MGYAETMFHQTSFGFVRRQLLDSLQSPHESPVSRHTPHGGSDDRPQQEQPLTMRSSLDRRPLPRRMASLRTRSTIPGARAAPASRMAQSYNEAGHYFAHGNLAGSHDFDLDRDLWGAPPGMRPLSGDRRRSMHEHHHDVGAHAGVGAGDSSHQASTSALAAAGSSEPAKAHHEMPSLGDGGVEGTALSGGGAPASSDVAALCRAVLEAHDGDSALEPLARRLLRDLQSH